MHVLINDVVRSSFIRYARFLKVKHRWVYWLAFCQSLIDLQAANRSPRGWIIYGTRIAGPTPCSPRSQVGRSKMSCRVKGALLASGLRQRLTTPHDMSTRAATTKKRKKQTNQNSRTRTAHETTGPQNRRLGPLGYADDGTGGLHTGLHTILFQKNKPQNSKKRNFPNGIPAKLRPQVP